jgi:hypothetical protein
MPMPGQLLRWKSSFPPPARAVETNKSVGNERIAAVLRMVRAPTHSTLPRIGWLLLAHFDMAVNCHEQRLERKTMATSNFVYGTYISTTPE